MTGHQLINTFDLTNQQSGVTDRRERLLQALRMGRGFRGFCGFRGFRGFRGFCGFRLLVMFRAKFVCL
jgi:hypothetical protein